MKTQKSAKNNFVDNTGVAANGLSHIPLFVPEWQKNLGKEELKNVADGNTSLMEWSEAKKRLKLK